MKKGSTVNFKQFFQKIYRDNLSKSPYNPIPTSTNKSHRTISYNDNSLGEFTNKCRLEEKEVRKGRPASSRVPIPYHRQMSSESVKYFNEIVENIKLEIIIKLKQKTRSENKSLYEEIISLEKLCKDLFSQGKKSSQLLQKFEEGLSKLLQHRTTRILFYLLYSKYLQCNTQKDQSKTTKNAKGEKNYSKELRYLLLCDEYGRILEVYYLSLYACNRIQQIFLHQKKYEESKEYARRFLRLAIFLKNPQYQFKAIQSLRIINYYCGIVNFSKDQYLRQRDRNGILKNYHPLNDKITSLGQLKYQAFEIERIPNEEDVTLTKNIERFVTNLTLMNKDLTQRSKNIVKTISKVNRVGSINKYFGSGLCITLQPRSRNLPDKNRGQILLTHTRKNSQLESKTKYYKFYFPKICSLIEALIQFSDST